jgi:UDP-N-acetylmuramate--alanine ligase
MSGLAQLLQWLGYQVAGSDRDVTSPGRDELISRLERLGIDVWPQDGSGVRQLNPRALIRSTAVEKENPDLQAAGDRPLLHRAAALAAALNRLPARQIAVAGSCGKTTVTAWIDQTLRALGQRVLTVCGGYMVAHETPRWPGNFAADPDPQWLVVEVDESDGSLVSFDPDLGVLLNVGTDHFARDALLALFEQFLRRCRHGVVLHDSLASRFASVGGQNARYFSSLDSERTRADTIAPVRYQARTQGIRFQAEPFGEIQVAQFGEHSAANGAAVLAVVQALGLDRAADQVRAAASAFRGVRRRFELAGETAAGVPVYDDYAHNVEKVCAALHTAQQLTPGRVLAIFQPHGYGPLGFMRGPLGQALPAVLRPQDQLGLLPVYYAGGSTSFRPASEEVALEYQEAGLPVTYFADRSAAAQQVAGIRPGEGVVLVMGARDPSLPHWIRSLTCPPSS